MLLFRLVVWRQKLDCNHWKTSGGSFMSKSCFSPISFYSFPSGSSSGSMTSMMHQLKLLNPEILSSYPYPVSSIHLKHNFFFQFFLSTSSEFFLDRSRVSYSSLLFFYLNCFTILAFQFKNFLFQVKTNELYWDRF